MHRAGTEAAERCGSRIFLSMGAKCRFVLVACHPKPGIARVGIDRFCILPQTKNNSIQACEANTPSGRLVFSYNRSGRTCRSILVQWQEDVLVKTSMLTAGTLGALGSRAWPVGRLANSPRSLRTPLVSKPDDRLLVAANKEIPPPDSHGLRHGLLSSCLS